MQHPGREREREREREEANPSPTRETGNHLSNPINCCSAAPAPARSYGINWIPRTRADEENINKPGLQDKEAASEKIKESIIAGRELRGQSRTVGQWDWLRTKKHACMLACNGERAERVSISLNDLTRALLLWCSYAGRLTSCWGRVIKT